MKPLVVVDARHLKSGIGTYIKNVLPGLINSTPWRWKIIGPDYWEQYRNERVQCVFSDLPLYSPYEQILVRKHAHGSNLLWVPQYNAPWFCGTKLVFTIHDFIHQMPQYTTNMIKRMISRQLIKRSFFQADQVITVSHYSKKILCEHFPMYQNKINVIHNGIQSVPECDRDPLYTNPYILSIGNALPHKNFLRLIQAFGSIHTFIKHDLVIAGLGGRQYEQIKACAAPYSSRIHLLPPQGTERWSNLIRNAALYVCPSLEEGFGMPPLEACSVGVPVAAAQASSLPEVLGEGAFWFDPYDIQDMAGVLQRALSDTQGRQEVVMKGKERIREFIWEKSVDKHRDVLGAVLEKAELMVK